LNDSPKSDTAHGDPDRLSSSESRAYEEVERASQEASDVVNRDDDSQEAGTGMLELVEKVGIRDKSAEDALVISKPFRSVSLIELREEGEEVLQYESR